VYDVAELWWIVLVKNGRRASDGEFNLEFNSGDVEQA